ncbi:MAG TPA: pyrroloquinoline quinone biosynthesis protein PqqE [Thiobacillus sp.]|uniref:pyrroloquinoline quinone biosynthesis protein PqqE n=1 Tax=unclassified Acidovorax TaxID=2684926 RepID=UPI000BD82FE2|nr:MULTISPECIES: pyrroloquinoline quinone biosynthesis protein PqqE [unclassified Acidovorax]OZA57029.1 MAG: pyrroloquinoline quinone biosynthesis protein PqqE [Acidovorax sp. 17-64-282]HQT71871.1 pyrroloquinoline quinone biosynthesis protein PqqE [Thiobacillus sp.]OYY25805.1 MAG: pyrroloquinoline quinone biosynthesis protein PqqE [Acidovorax sp. 35-64-16]OYY83912.1 MAG: pyrroloquinoline quinone biosynthesis protein PqqE [Acidovorax sp. 28-64-14]OYZ43065.1 MAG: pyrroloquinoline quinone biosynt
MPKESTGVSLDGQGKPLWLALELTYRCPLKCSWCSNPLNFEDYAALELSTDEWRRVMREARALGSLQVGFTGGEPLQRKDLEELVAYAEEIGLYSNLITSGVGLTEERLIALKQAGLKQIQLSMQSTEAALTDELVGAKAHLLKLEAARLIKAHGFPMVLNMPVGRQNISQVGAMIDYAASLGAEYLELANLQYYNWALINREELMPSLEQVRAAETVVQGKRAQLGKKMAIYYVIPDYYEDRPKACMNGWGAIHLTVAPDGVAMPCQESRMIPGLEFVSVRDRPLDWIWHESPLFRKYRGLDWLPEACRSCDEREKDFGGCRCQAFLLTGDAGNTDPACSKSPHHHLIQAAVQAAAQPIRFHKPLVRRANGVMSTAFLED